MSPFPLARLPFRALHLIRHFCEEYATVRVHERVANDYKRKDGITILQIPYSYTVYLPSLSQKTRCSMMEDKYYLDAISFITAICPVEPGVAAIAVERVGFSDTFWMVPGSRENDITLFRFHVYPTRVNEMLLCGHTDKITGLVFLAPHHLVSCSMDQTLRVWHIYETGICPAAEEARRRAPACTITVRGYSLYSMIAISPTRVACLGAKWLCDELPTTPPTLFIIDVVDQRVIESVPLHHLPLVRQAHDLLVTREQGLCIRVGHLDRVAVNRWISRSTLRLETFPVGTGALATVTSGSKWPFILIPVSDWCMDTMDETVKMTVAMNISATSLSTRSIPALELIDDAIHDAALRVGVVAFPRPAPLRMLYGNAQRERIQAPPPRPPAPACCVIS